MKKVQSISLLFASMALVISCNNNPQPEQEIETTKVGMTIEEEQQSTNATFTFLSSVDLSGVKNMTPTELAKNLNNAINANCYDDAKIRIPETPYFVQLTKRIVTNPNHWEIMNLCTMARYESIPMKIGTITEIYSSACEADGGYSYKVLFNSSYDELFDMEIIIYNGPAVGMEPDSAIYRWSNIEKQGL